MPIVEYLFILTLALLILTLLNYIWDLTHWIALHDRVITQLDTKQREQDALLEAHHKQLNSYRTAVQSLLQQLRDHSTVLIQQAAPITQFNDALINVETLREFIEVTQKLKGRTKRSMNALASRLIMWTLHSNNHQPCPYLRLRKMLKRPSYFGDQLLKNQQSDNIPTEPNTQSVSPNPNFLPDSIPTATLTNWDQFFQLCKEEYKARKQSDWVDKNPARWQKPSLKCVPYFYFWTQPKRPHSQWTSQTTHHSTTWFHWAIPKPSSYH